MTHFQICPRFYQVKSSDQSFMIISLKMWPLERTQGFSNICPSDLVFGPTTQGFPWPPSFFEFRGFWPPNFSKWPPKFIILPSMIHMKGVIVTLCTKSRGKTLNMTHFQTPPRFHWGKLSDPVSWELDQKCGLKSLHKVFLRFDLVSSFLTRQDPFSNSSFTSSG